MQSKYFLYSNFLLVYPTVLCGNIIKKIWEKFVWIFQKLSIKHILKSRNFLLISWKYWICSYYFIWEFPIFKEWNGKGPTDWQFKSEYIIPVSLNFALLNGRIFPYPLEFRIRVQNIRYILQSRRRPLSLRCTELRSRAMYTILSERRQLSAIVHT